MLDTSAVEEEMKLMGRIAYWIARKIGTKLGAKITSRFLNEVKSDFRVGLQFEDASAYKDAADLGATTESGFRGVWLRIKLDNRSKEGVSVESTTLRIFINGVPYKDLYWDEELLTLRDVKEVEFYPSTTISEEGFLTLRVFVPHWIDIEPGLWIGVCGFLCLRSPFGKFRKEVRAEKQIRRDEWR